MFSILVIACWAINLLSSFLISAICVDAVVIIRLVTNAVIIGCYVKKGYFKSDNTGYGKIVNIALIVFMVIDLVMLVMAYGGLTKVDESLINVVSRQQQLEVYKREAAGNLRLTGTLTAVIYFIKEMRQKAAANQ